MWRLTAVVLLCAPLASSQVLVDAGRAAELLRQLRPHQRGSQAALGSSRAEVAGPPRSALPALTEATDSLLCELKPVAPALTFSFRFQAGYLATVPLNQFHGPGHWISVLTQVTPRAGDRQPVYLLRTFDLPDVPDTDFSANLAGAFLVGDGHYQANAVLFDDANRSCRANWQIEVKHGSRTLYGRSTLLPDSVAPVNMAELVSPATGADAVRGRLTIFLHAAPVNPRMIKLNANDVVMTMASLAALLEQLPARSIRLVVFNLLQQQELYRNDNFTSDSLEQVTRVLDGLQLGQVHYQELQHANQQRDLLRNLIRREMNEPSRLKRCHLPGT